MSPNDREVRTGDGGRVDAEFLRRWPLPEPGGSKRSRGTVVVVGGAARSPGAVLLAGRAALRVGAGRLTLAIGASTSTAAAVGFPESGVIPLSESGAGSVRGSSVSRAAAELCAADAILVGPGLDDIAETRRMLRRVCRIIGRGTGPTLIVDAFALGALAGMGRLGAGDRILTPNSEEAELLLGRRLDEVGDGVLAIAQRYRAVVTCHGWVAEPGGRLLRIEAGNPGLGTSGSGDVLAGAIAGLAARGCDPFQAAVWGTYLHMAAGDALARAIAPVGFLAGEIADRLPAELIAVDGGHPEKD